MSTDIVKVSNKSYSVSQLPTDRARRRKYFNTFKEDTGAQHGELTAEESQLLMDLGMDAKMINTLKLYLPTFFDNLHACSSDSSLVLNKTCNIPYYVLWSIMLANKETTDERLRENKLKYSTKQIDVAMNTTTIAGLRPKEITDEYDKLFQLLLTTSSPTVSKLTDNDFAHLFQLPTNVDGRDGKDGKDGKEKEEEDEPLTGLNQEYANKINKLFKLILISPPSSEKKNLKLDELSAKLIKLDRERKAPIYTFTQLGNTCATDSLFTILLQADGIKQLFIQNVTSLYTYENNNLIPINKAIHYAIQRYINMLQLESEDIGNKSSRKSVNLGRINPFGESILKEISKEDACIGASRSDIIRYLEELKVLLQTIPNINLLNFFYGFNLRNNYINKDIINKNLNTIKALYLTYPTNSSLDEHTGHAISILKIQNEWYISDNEVGFLHKIIDSKFIPILFHKLYHAADNPKSEICQMWNVKKERQYEQNLVSFFVFEFGGNQYIYPDNPDNNIPGTKDIHTPIVNAERTIVFTYNEENKDPVLENISANLNLSEDKFMRILNGDR